MRFAFRTHGEPGGGGGHLLDQTFVTPQEAGIWFRTNFGTDLGSVPLTFVALDRHGETHRVIPEEWCAMHWVVTREMLEAEYCERLDSILDAIDRAMEERE